MVDRSFFAHENPDGKDPFDRMHDQGYQFTTAAENLATVRSTLGVSVEGNVVGLHRGLFVDSDVPGRGHRLGILNETVREVGIGFAHGVVSTSNGDRDAVLLTEDYGVLSSPKVLLLGVVYDDADSSGSYQAGEGVSGVTVDCEGALWGTRTAGGFGFALAANGTFTLTFRNADLGINSTQEVTINGTSKKVDFVKGTGIVVAR
jgi:hypothetical protein